jgi:hypothetical protein
VKKVPKIKKTMGKKVGQYDNQFEIVLKKMVGNNNARRIMTRPSAMKRAYSMYLQGKLADITPDEILF